MFLGVVKVYERQQQIPSLPDAVQCASVDTFDPNFVQLRSTATIPPLIEPPSELFDVLRSYYGNESLWQNLAVVVMEMAMLRSRVILGTLITVHDGSSYTRDVAPDISSASVIIKCTKTDYQATCTLTERSPLASNYAGLHITRAASTKAGHYAPVKCYIVITKESQSCECVENRNKPT